MLVLALLFQPGCKQSTESLVLDYLAKKYEQPSNNVWEDGKYYFLLEDSKLELLGHEAGLSGLSVYRTSLWFIHWGHEKVPLLVWAIEEQYGELQLGVLEEPKEIAEVFPRILKEVTFESPKLRRKFALLLVEMVSVYEVYPLAGELAVTSEGDCEWAERVEASQGKRHRIAAACFSDKGVLERILLPPREQSWPTRAESEPQGAGSTSSPAAAPAAE